jgi:rod shape-determining protein MreD
MLAPRRWPKACPEMVERRQTQRLLYMLLFLGLALLVTFFRLLPLGSYGFPLGPILPEVEDNVTQGWGLRNLPMPDLMLCLTLAWVVRRPSMLPAWVIVVYFFLEDILLMRPPGLWALVVLLATEFLRKRTEHLRQHGFLLEYMMIFAVMLAMFVANRAVLAIVMGPQAPLGLSLAQFLGTVLAYPAIVALSHFVFGLRKPATGEVDALGQRL